MTQRLRFLLVLAAVLALVLVPATVVAAQSADVFAANEPAVEMPPDAEDDEEQPWTARFLAPATLANCDEKLRPVISLPYRIRWAPSSRTAISTIPAVGSLPQISL